MTTTVTAKIQLRKGTAAAWTSANPVLLSGEVGFETDTHKVKIGDGTTAWISLAYHHDPDLAATYAAIAHTHSGVYEPANANLQAHISSTVNPHSVTAGQVGADATGTASGLLASHVAAADPHPGYLTPTEGDAAYAAASHAHSGVYDPAGTASSAVSAHAGGSSVHAIASVTGLQTALDGKSATSHDHAATYAPLAKGVTNGDSHDHNGGDGAQIAYSTLSGLPTLGTAAAQNTGAFEPAATVEINAALADDDTFPTYDTSATAQKKSLMSRLWTYIASKLSSYSGDLTANSFSLSGNISAAAWTTAGIRHKNIAATLTDTSSSGTVATAYTNVFGGNTIAASNSVTFTNYGTAYLATPVAGTNVTITNAYSLITQGPIRIGSLPAVTGDNVQSVVKLTQAAYDALTPKVSTTLYVVTG